jgi:hypothetical protein
MSKIDWERPLNPPMLGDFEPSAIILSYSPQSWGVRGAIIIPKISSENAIKF